ncbi:MAG TPA: PLP-dependent transferase, partial [Spirochaetota bacterium]|nr:PLP-dependent transferase [Spirochaetota bacterium]
MNYDTKIIHNGSEIDKITGALSVPIYQVSTFYQSDIENPGKYMYSRSENPTREALEKTVAVLENGKYGYAFASGMAAITSALLGFLKSGDHIVATQDIYGGTYRFLTKFLPRFGIETTFVDMTNSQNIRKAIKQNTRVLFIETPSNPLLTITDIKECAIITKEFNLISMIDNTFMTPYFQKPLDFGIDISIHSATKFLGGHSDLVAGIVVTSNEEYAKKIYSVQNDFGS